MPSKLPSQYAAPPLAALVLGTVGCGGGGGGGDGGAPPPAPPPPPVFAVTAVTAGTPKYSQPLLITVTGTKLDQGLAATAAGCNGMALSTTAPNISSATTAYFTCTISAVGPGRVAVTAAGGGAELGAASYTVPQPQVTLAVSNGAGVNGDVVVTLDAVKAPVTVNNFLAYVNTSFYNGTVFHRVVPGFVVQGGGYTAFVNGVPPAPKPTNAPIALEVNVGLSNVQWSIAMARAAAANSATSQFFINLVNNANLLDPSATSAGYAVFGSVTAGTAVVASMAAAPCAPAAGVSECAPNPNVVITTAQQTQ